MEKQTPRTTLIVGFGYIGKLIAQLATNDNHNIRTITRSANQPRQSGIDITVADLDQNIGKQIPITPHTDLFYTAPPQQDGTQDDRLRYFLSVLSEPPASFVYISTSGVYGDYRGAWVTEEDELKSDAPRSLQRIDAEKTLLQWHSHNQGTHLVILRSAGIYGPQRLPVDRIKRHAPLVDQNELHAYLNLIHAEDLARICRKAITHCQSREIYNVCDGSPTTMTHYLNHVADQLNLSKPPIVSLEDAHKTISPGMMKYLSESKRLSNKKLLAALHENLSYPNYITGVKQAVEATQKAEN